MNDYDYDDYLAYDRPYDRCNICNERATWEEVRPSGDIIHWCGQNRCDKEERKTLPTMQAAVPVAPDPEVCVEEYYGTPCRCPEAHPIRPRKW